MADWVVSEQEEAKPVRLDLRDVLPDWHWSDGPDFEIWGGDVLRHAPREHWHEFDRRWMYQVDADGAWEKSRRL